MQLTVESSVADAHVPVLIGSLDLCQIDHGVKVGDAVIEADVVVQACALGIKREAEVLVITSGRGQGVIVCHDHAAFAGGQVLVGEGRTA